MVRGSFDYNPNSGYASGQSLQRPPSQAVIDMNPVKLTSGPYEIGEINNGGLYNTGGSAAQGMNEDKPIAPADSSYLNMQNNLKSLQSKIMDLENKLNRVNVEDTGNSMTISGMEHSSLMAGGASNPNLIRDIQIPTQQQQ